MEAGRSAVLAERRTGDRLALELAEIGHRHERAVARLHAIESSRARAFAVGLRRLAARGRTVVGRGRRG